MKFDRFLVKEFLLFSLLGFLSVLLIYDLVNLIERMGYFLSLGASAKNMFFYYFYDIPITTNLLFPVGFTLGCFIVVGRLIKNNELIPLIASGVNLYRIFAVFLAVSLAAAAFLFIQTELLGTVSKTRFIEYKRTQIEHRSAVRSTVRQDVKYLSGENRLYYIRQLYIQDSMLTDLIIWEFGTNQEIKRTIKTPRAAFDNTGKWVGENVEIYDFQGQESKFAFYKKRILKEMNESPDELGIRTKETQEMKLAELRRYISRMSAAGVSVNIEKVEYNYRFASPFIVVIVTVLSFAAATLLRKSNLTLGVGLGLLLGFLYWGLIQASKAFGYEGAFSPWFAAWLPNILFFAISVVILFKIRR